MELLNNEARTVGGLAKGPNNSPQFPYPSLREELKDCVIQLDKHGMYHSMVHSVLPSLAFAFSKLLQNSIRVKRCRTLFSASSADAFVDCVYLSVTLAKQLGNSMQRKVAVSGRSIHSSETRHHIDQVVSSNLNIQNFGDTNELIGAIRTGEFACVIIAVDTKELVSDQTAYIRKLKKVRKIAQQTGCVFCLDESRFQASDVLALSKRLEVDISIVGESICDFRLPFGALIFAQDLSEKMRALTAGQISSSGSICDPLIACLILTRLQQKGRLDKNVMHFCRQLSKNADMAAKYLADYIQFMPDLKLLRSLQTYAAVTPSYQCLVKAEYDWVKSLDSLNPNTNYINELSQYISAKSPFNQFTVTTSRHEAIQIAMYKAQLMASKQHIRVLWVSRHRPAAILTLFEGIKWFAPSKGLDELTNILNRRQYALVWINDDNWPTSYPKEIINSLNKGKDVHNYMLGAVADTFALQGRPEQAFENVDILLLNDTFRRCPFKFGIMLSKGASFIEGAASLEQLVDCDKQQFVAFLLYQTLIGSYNTSRQTTRSLEQQFLLLESYTAGNNVFSRSERMPNSLTLSLNHLYFPTQWLREKLFTPYVSRFLATRFGIINERLCIRAPESQQEMEKLLWASEHLSTPRFTAVKTLMFVAHQACRDVFIWFKRLIIKQPVDLNGKRILITGASSGIGKALAKSLSRIDCTLVLVARRNIKDEIGEQLADKATVIYLQADVSQSDDLERIFITTKDTLGGLDILVNNAGISLRRNVISVARNALTDIERSLEVNYTAAAKLALMFLPLMQAQGGGQLITSQSIVSGLPSPMFASYSASKAALRKFMSVLRIETTGQNIQVTDVILPLVKTPMATATDAYKADSLVEVDVVVEKMIGAMVRPSRLVDFKEGKRIAAFISRILPNFAERVVGFKYKMDTALERGEPLPEFATNLLALVSKFAKRD